VWVEKQEKLRTSAKVHGGPTNAGWKHLEKGAERSHAQRLPNSLQKAASLIEELCLEVPVVGFNSARYDLNLIR